ncbi:MAG: type IV toxin-antitoxin system AbiEi family antitoxin domain-containing protein [Chloroflexi bacterium]|nr:type IV toxin-antitoxin system AbiEi family antitoxin domain-containing protein [Chloroflexota bacterium]
MAGISPGNRRRLTTLHRAVRGPFTIDEAAAALAFDRERTAKLLSHWVRQGWLARISSGVYLTVPLEAESPASWVEDAWAVLSRVFEPCYIGGWSACEHWGFTEQLFRDVVLFTAKPIRQRRGSIQGTAFVAKVVPEARLFGTRRIWRRDVQIDVSDPSRTIVDVLDEPKIGGGMRHVADVVRMYFASEHRNDSDLLSYARRVGNRTVYKRLGLLIERLGIAAPRVVAECLARQSAGYSKLDPAGPNRGRFLRRWRVRENIEIRRPR